MAQPTAQEIARSVSENNLIYRQYIRPAILTLARSKLNKTYDRQTALATWERVAKHVSTASPATRTAVARELQAVWQPELTNTHKILSALVRVGGK